MKMIMYRISSFMAAAVVLSCLLLCACGGSEFKVKGDVEGADNAPIVIEKASSSGTWIVMDSTRTDSSGHFSISIAAPASSEIYRLRSGDEFVYFPIDSIETVTVHTAARSFGRGYRLTGSDNAVAMARFDSLLNTLPADADNAARDAFKRTVYKEFIASSRGSIVSYYILTKTIDGRPLYDGSNPVDAKYFAAVATAFEQYKPGDPRTEMLKNISLRAMSRASAAKGHERVVHATEVKAFEIDLPDTKGSKRQLTPMLGKGKPVILVFTALTAKGAPQYNAELKKIYDAGRADIYMVGLDADRYGWRDAAINLPWTNVYAVDGMDSRFLIDYNVTSVPTGFIFNAAGDLVNRIEDVTKVSSML